jgi:alkylhydroperoxidase family enzyme
MYNPDTDLLFPPRTLTALRDLRGTTWRDLVTDVIEAGPESLEQMAFILMMARMNNCATCNADSYRAINGCTACAKQSLKRSHESDEVLIEIFQTTKGEVEQFLQKKANP